MVHNRIAIPVVTLLVLLLSACGGGSQPAASPVPASAREVIVSVDNQLKFNPATLELAAGQPVRLVLKNEGALEHDFTIDEIDVKIGETAEHGHASGAASDAALHVHTNPGETSEITFTPQQSGTYTFYCTVPGHKEGGMQGSLTVK